jgi:hypothetical protein
MSNLTGGFRQIGQVALKGKLSSAGLFMEDTSILAACVQGNGKSRASSFAHVCVDCPGPRMFQ